MSCTYGWLPLFIQITISGCRVWQGFNVVWRPFLVAGNLAETCLITHDTKKHLIHKRGSRSLGWTHLILQGTLLPRTEHLQAPSTRSAVNPMVLNGSLKGFSPACHLPFTFKSWEPPGWSFMNFCSCTSKYTGTHTGHHDGHGTGTPPVFPSK